MGARERGYTGVDVLSLRSQRKGALMRHVTTIHVVLSLGVALSAFVADGAAAQACLFSGVASAYADGIVARPVTGAPGDPRQMALWAPFAFRQTFAPGRVLHLREDMREVARSQGAEALHWRVLWLFGDGARAHGVAVAHAYRRPGIYRVDVQADFVGPSGLPSWHDFDVMDVVVGHMPARVTWLRPAPSTTPTVRSERGATAAPRITPTPGPTGAAG